MAQISWTTPAGDLGTHPEEAEFSLQLEAENFSAGSLTYKVIAGELPPGIQLYKSGFLYGIPVVTNPTSLSAVKYSFTVRANNAAGQIADRAFYISINGIIPPTLETKVESLGIFFDSDFIDVAISYSEFNPQATLQWTVTSGTLPLGLTLTQNGHITGFAEAPPAGGALGAAAWDVGGWDYRRVNPTTGKTEVISWDFEGATLSRVYQFGIRLYDGLQSDERHYSLTVYAKSFFRTDNTLIQGDTTQFTADRDGYAYPTITTPAGYLESIRADRSYAFQFQAYYANPNTPVYWRLQSAGLAGPERFDMGAIPTPDDNGDIYTTAPFDIKSFDQPNLALPPGLSLDNRTGWLTGTIGTLAKADAEYTFTVVAYVQITNSATNDVSIRESAPITYRLKILESINNLIVWDTVTDLGTITNGEVSTLSIAAHVERAGIIDNNVALSYTVVSGQYGRLPQGLQLLPSGNISGRTTFDYFSMDRRSYEVKLDKNHTRFDTKYTFTVLVQDSSGYIYDTKTFTVTVTNVNNKPYENLYIRAFLPSELRERFRTTVQDPNLTLDLGYTAIYRSDDPYFGLANDLKFLALPGLTASELQNYVAAMDLYHRDKKINLTELKHAVALDDNFNVKYEVVYAEVVDYNTEAMSKSSINLSGKPVAPITDAGSLSTGQSLLDQGVLFEGVNANQDYGNLTAITETTEKISLSNSFGNLDRAIIKNIGYQYQGALPRWMTSIQPDTGKAVGFVRAVVLAHLAPGWGKTILFRYQSGLESSGFGVTTLMNQYAFTADRYQIDRALTTNYDPVSQRFEKAISTTFDVIPSIGKVDQGAWLNRQSTTTKTLRAIDYGGGEFIAVGDASTIVSSVGGETWKPEPKTINLTYNVSLGQDAIAGATTFQFPYGKHFSLGDELLNQNSFVSANKSFVTGIVDLARLSNPVAGIIPAGTTIEFGDYIGNTFNLTLSASAALGTSNLQFANVAKLSPGYSVQIRGIDNWAGVGERITAIAGNVSLTFSEIGLGYNPATVGVTFSFPTTPSGHIIPGGIAATGRVYLFANGAVKSVGLVDPGFGYVDGSLVEINITGSSITAASVNDGVTLTTRGNEICNILSIDSGTNSITLSRPTTNLIVSGTRIAFNDFQGNTATLYTATNTPIGNTVIAFTTTVVNNAIKAGRSSVTIANIAAGSVVRALNSNVTVTDATTNNLFQGTELIFKNKITSGASAGDVVLNISSTDKIAVGSSVTSPSITGATAATAYWPTIPTGSIDATITISSADIIGTYPSVGMTVIGNGIPRSNTVIDVIAGDEETSIVIEFDAISSALPGNPKTVITSNAVSTVVSTASLFNTLQTYISPIGTQPNIQPKFSSQTLVSVESYDHINLNDYVISANLALTDKVRVTNIFSNSKITISTATKVINTGEDITFQPDISAIDFIIPGIVPTGTVVTAKTATSVILSAPLLAPVGLEYDNLITFGLTDIQLNFVLYTGSDWLAVGAAGVVFQRGENKLWSQQRALPYGDLTGIAYDPQSVTWVIIGTEGIVARSTDFVTWTRVAVGVSTTLRSIDFYDGTWVAVGDKGTILYSVNQGLTWNINNSTTTLNLKGVRYANNLWIAVGEKGKVLISQDGITWPVDQIYSTGVTSTLYDVTYINNQYIAVGNNGVIVETADVARWNSYNTGLKGSLYSIANLINVPTVVGANGLILSQSDSFTVKYAVRGVTFEMFNFNTLAELALLGYPVEVGDTLIFAQQEKFNPGIHKGTEFMNEGWNLYKDQWGGSAVGMSYDSTAYDEYTVIPGYNENLIDNNIANQRAGVWQVLLNDFGIAYLDFVRTIQLNQVVTIIAENSRLVYDSVVKPGFTVPGFREVHQSLNSSAAATVFDSSGTRFSSPRDHYLTDPYTYDKYIKFPISGVI